MRVQPAFLFTAFAVVLLSFASLSMAQQASGGAVAPGAVGTSFTGTTDSAVTTQTNTATYTTQTNTNPATTAWQPEGQTTSGIAPTPRTDTQVTTAEGGANAFVRGDTPIKTMPASVSNPNTQLQPVSGFIRTDTVVQTSLPPADSNINTTTVAPFASSPRTLTPAPSDPGTAGTVSPIITPDQSAGDVIKTIANDAANRVSATQLEAIGTDLKRTQQYVDKIKTSASEVFTTGIRNSVSLQPQQTPRAEDASQEVIQTRLRVSAILENVAKDTAPQTGPVVESLLSSSLSDIQIAIRQETGADVQFSARNVRDVTAENTAAIQRSTEALQSRDGLDLYLDSDNDGVSDYDETHIYHTDPRSKYTANGYLTDGERILIGLDPHSTSTTLVPVDPPSNADQVSRSIFQVTAIKTISPPVVATSSPIATSTELTPEQIPNQTFSPKVLSFEGTGLPNSFVTLYIFSSPVVVTVKTDINGNWKYTLDSELPDGSHELYVAMVNNDGHVIARSPAVPFIKQAEAVTYIPLVTPPVTDPSLVDTLRDKMLVVAGILFLLFSGAAVIVAGFMRRSSGLPPASPPAPAVPPSLTPRQTKIVA